MPRNEPKPQIPAGKSARGHHSRRDSNLPRNTVRQRRMRVRLRPRAREAIMTSRNVCRRRRRQPHPADWIYVVLRCLAMIPAAVEGLRCLVDLVRRYLE
jgi:hypothetical protein